MFSLIKKPVIIVSLLLVGTINALNKDKMHSLYVDGEFSQLIQELEKAVKSGERASKSDSIFLAKHLGVAYAANPASREKGMYWLRQMLILDPQENLLDMYVGASVDQLFQKVKQEYFAENPDLKVKRVEEVEKVESSHKQEVKAKKKNGRSKWIWASAGVGVVAIGTVTYFLLASPSETSDPTIINVPKGNANR